MGFLDLFGKKEVPRGAANFDLQCAMHPLRLVAHKSEYLELEASLRNVFDKELLTSLVVKVPKGLGFDASALSQEREIRIGMLQRGEAKHLTIPVWATQRTNPGTYRISVYAISHYRDYGYVLNEVVKTMELRVV